MKYLANKNQNVSYLDNFLLEKNGDLKIVESRLLKSLQINDLQAWCKLRGIYCLPTKELIFWLKEEINNRLALEICAGIGLIGRHLNIKSTDGYHQASPEMVNFYKFIKQGPIMPPPDVEKFEANDAVDFYNPQVVIGSYVTQKCDENKKTTSSLRGVDEISLLKKIQTYIFIGNKDEHGNKTILEKPHRIYQFDWLFTRSDNPKNNLIYVLENINYQSNS